MRMPARKLNWMLIPILLTLAAVTGCSSRASEPVSVYPYVDISHYSEQSDKQQHVVLLHGMFRSKVAMRPVEKYLQALGYQTTNISYPSTQYDIETLVDDYLVPEIENLANRDDITLHFATHSMGGILVRYYLQERELHNLGRVVMIAPPNKGTPLAELFADSDWIDTRNNPAKAQLGADEESWVNQLQAGDFEVGIIAGDHNNNIVTSVLLPGDDDGVVSVESTKLDSMKDFITVPAKHYQLRSNTSVLEQVGHFIKFGKFFRLSEFTPEST